MREMTQDEDLAERAADLREAFDRSFADEVAPQTEDTVEFLGVVVEGDFYALDLAEIGGLYVDRAVTPLPSAAQGQLGVARLAGGLAPVYDLGQLLGHPSAGEPGRWLALAAGAKTVAFALDRLDGHLRIPRSAVTPVPPDQARRHVVALAAFLGRTWRVLQVGSLVALIENQNRPGP
jgi:chemotaxis signal transduction protein